MTETLERLAPEAVICAGRMAPVTSARAYPPYRAPDGAPIKRSLHTLELVTPLGSRWYGFTRAPWIGADLRMHVVLDDPRDEVRFAWERPNED